MSFQWNSIGEQNLNDTYTEKNNKKTRKRAIADSAYEHYLVTTDLVTQFQTIISGRNATGME